MYATRNACGDRATGHDLTLACTRRVLATGRGIPRGRLIGYAATVKSGVVRIRYRHQRTNHLEMLCKIAKEGVMKITETGHYRLTKEWSSQGAYSISHFPAGREIVITQVDKRGRKVIGPDFNDWAPDEMPVEKIAGRE